MNLDDGRAIGDVRASLLDFLDRCGRDLPWRTGRNPYRVLVSEIMLQQTRAETVKDRYVRWLQRFPGWRELASASLDEVLLEWKGLGYYARARNLHRTAGIVCERHGGELPTQPEELKKLPGVGDYTAGAVASIAFGRAVPAVDGNVRRVLCRLLDLADPSPARLRDEAARLLHPTRPGHHNEAMMELGATVCTPRTPRCPTCPVRPHCAAHRLGTVLKRPLRRPRPRLRKVDYAAAVAIDRAGRVLVVRRPKEGLLGGMWEFPSVELSGTAAAREPRNRKSNRHLRHCRMATAAVERLGELGFHGVARGTLAPVRHTFTHLRARYHPVLVRVGASAARAAPLAVQPAPGAGSPALPRRDQAASEAASQATGSPAIAPAAPSSSTASPATLCWTDPAGLDSFALSVAQQEIAVLLAEALKEGVGWQVAQAAPEPMRDIDSTADQGQEGAAR